MPASMAGFRTVSPVVVKWVIANRKALNKIKEARQLLMLDTVFRILMIPSVLGILYFVVNGNKIIYVGIFIVLSLCFIYLMSFVQTRLYNKFKSVVGQKAVES